MLDKTTNNAFYNALVKAARTGIAAPF